MYEKISERSEGIFLLYVMDEADTANNLSKYSIKLSMILQSLFEPITTLPSSLIPLLLQMYVL